MLYKYSNININYEIIGSGKPVLMLHGLWCSLDLMKYCMEPVFEKAEGYQRIYVDLPGMGKSGSRPELAESDKILEFLLAFIQDIIQEDFLMAGESYGGYLARGILAKLRERVEGMLLLCPVVIPDRSKRFLPDKVMFGDRAYLESLNADEKSGFCEYAVIANEETHSRYKKEVLAGIEQSDSVFLEQLDKYYTFGFDVDKVIRDLHFIKPVLLICGRQDNCVGYRDLWGLIEDYPRAAFMVLDAAGHNLQIEQPGLFQAAVCNWLMRVEKY